MGKPTQIAKITVYADVNVEELWVMVEQGIITLYEYFTALQTGKIENDKVRVYKKQQV